MAAAVNKKVNIIQTSQKKLTRVFNIPVTWKYIVLSLITFCFYANSLSDDYALDDEAVIQRNDYVQKGIAGIGKILTSDAYDCYYKQNNANQALSGGRYRPLSIVFFAIEHSIFGESTVVRHLINILLYILCVLTVFYFLRNFLLKKLLYGEDIAFLSSFLFAIHPIHTEVVANVKSSDEILSLVLIICTLIFSLQSSESSSERDGARGKKYSLIMYILSLITFFLALLSKEYAITLVILLPMLHYLYFKEKQNFQGLLKKFFPSLIPIGLYLLIRIGSIGFPHQQNELDILNNPYRYASFAQRLGTEIFVLGKYLFMLFIPYPLASDYGFAQIPLRNFSSPDVWLSLVSYAGILFMGIQFLRKNNILAFPVFFFLLNLFMVSNLIINIGATMGERLIFHSSMGFLVIISYYILRSLQKINIQNRRVLLLAFLFLLTGMFGIEIFERNKDWKNTFTLFLKDVKTVPNSVKANDDAGVYYVNLSVATKDSAESTYYVQSGLKYLYRAAQLDNADINGCLNIGIAYCKLAEPDSCKKYWDAAKRLYSGQPNLPEYYQVLGKMYLFKGEEAGRHGDFYGAVKKMKLGLECDPSNVDLIFNLGISFLNTQQPDSARLYFEMTAKINPNYPDLQRAMKALPK